MEYTLQKRTHNSSLHVQTVNIQPFFTCCIICAKSAKDYVIYKTVAPY